MAKNKHKKKIHIGADHRGYCLKFSLKTYLTKKGYEVIDHGNHQYKSTDDFPVFGKKVCQAVVKDKFKTPGILICGYQKPTGRHLLTGDEVRLCRSHSQF